MPASWVTALALSAQLVAPALPTTSPRLSLHDSTLISALAPVRDTTTGQQAASKPSKRGRMIAGAVIGFAVGSVLGVTVGQESCLNQSKWVCIAKGGGYGAALGVLIGLK
jgi:uncharacterized protein YcfJ